jgi:hypothetical protein
MTQRRDIMLDELPEVMTRRSRRPSGRRSRRSGPLRRIARQMFFSYGLWLLAAAVVLITAVISEVPMFGAYSEGVTSPSPTTGIGTPAHTP